MRWNLNFTHSGRRLQYLTRNRLILLRDFDQAVHLVVGADLCIRCDQGALSGCVARTAGSVACVAGRGVNFRAVDFAVCTDRETAGRANVNGLADPAAALFPFAGSVGYFDAFGHSFKRGWHGLKTLAGFTHHHALGHGFVRRWNNFQTRAGGGSLYLLADGAQWNLNRLVAQRFRGDQNALSHHTEGRRNRLSAGHRWFVDHRFFNFTVHRWDHFELFTLRRHHHLLGRRFERAGHHFDALAFGFDQHLLGDVFVGRGNRLFTERLRLDHDGLGDRLEGGVHRDLTLEFRAHQHLLSHRLERCWHRDEALGLRLHQHLLAHRFVRRGNRNLALGFRRHEHLLSHGLHRRCNWDVALGLRLHKNLFGHRAGGGWNDFEALGGGNFYHLLGLRFKARADDDIREAITAAGQQCDWARKVVAEIVVALLHRNAHQLTGGVGVQIDWHIRAVRNILSDQRCAYAVAAL